MAIADLINQTALRLANGDQEGAERIVGTIRSGKIEDISKMADYLGVSAEGLAALNLGKPLTEEDFGNFQEETLSQPTLQSEVAKRTEANLAKRLQDIYNQVFNQGAQDISDQFNPIRKRQISEERALGRLTSPGSIPGLSRIDEAQGKAISNLSSNLAGQRAGQEFGLA